MEKPGQLRNNNFDAIRHLAAASVIITHSYAIAGLPEQDPLQQATGLGLSYVAVRVFFVISGFLIMLSALNAKGPLDYLKKRALRIYPALIVVTLLSIGIVGAIYTMLPIATYFSNPLTAKYLLTCSAFFTQYSLPGVFSNHPTSAINGSLWTILYEATLYIVILALVQFKAIPNTVKIYGALAGLLLARVYFSIYPLHWQSGIPYASEAGLNYQYSHVIGLGIYFFIGAAVAVSKRFPMPKVWLIAIGVVAFGVYCALKPSELLTDFLLYVSIGVGVFGLAYTTIWPALNRFGKYGDFSYGIYIYAFPVQQILFAQGFAGYGTWAFAAVSLCVTLVCAFGSWHLVEKHALRLK